MKLSDATPQQRELAQRIEAMAREKVEDLVSDMRVLRFPAELRAATLQTMATIAIKEALKK